MAHGFRISETTWQKQSAHPDPSWEMWLGTSLKSPLWPCSRWQLVFSMNLQANYSNIVANVTKVFQ